MPFLIIQLFDYSLWTWHTKLCFFRGEENVLRSHKAFLNCFQISVSMCRLAFLGEPHSFVAAVFFLVISKIGIFVFLSVICTWYLCVLSCLWQKRRRIPIFVFPCSASFSFFRYISWCISVEVMFFLQNTCENSRCPLINFILLSPSFRLFLAIFDVVSNYFPRSLVSPKMWTQLSFIDNLENNTRGKSESFMKRNII